MDFKNWTVKKPSFGRRKLLSTISTVAVPVPTDMTVNREVNGDDSNVVICINRHKDGHAFHEGLAPGRRGDLNCGRIVIRRACYREDVSNGIVVVGRNSPCTVGDLMKTAQTVVAISGFTGDGSRCQPKNRGGAEQHRKESTLPHGKTPLTTTSLDLIRAPLYASETCLSTVNDSVANMGAFNLPKNGPF